jgi:hypothetical protein
MNLFERRHHVGERIAPTGRDPALKLAAAADHLVEQDLQVGRLHLVPSGRRAQHRREADRLEAEPDEMVEGGAQAEIGRRHGHPRGHLHPPLLCSSGRTLGSPS